MADLLSPDDHLALAQILRDHGAHAERLRQHDQELAALRDNVAAITQESGETKRTLARILKILAKKARQDDYVYSFVARTDLAARKRTKVDAARSKEVTGRLNATLTGLSGVLLLVIGLGIQQLKMLPLVVTWGVGGGLLVLYILVTFWLIHRSHRGVEDADVESLTVSDEEVRELLRSHPSPLTSDAINEVLGDDQEED